MDEKLYDTSEVAGYFKVHPKTVQKWIKNGKLKGRKVARKWLFTGAQIQEVLNRMADESEEEIEEP